MAELTIAYPDSPLSVRAGRRRGGAEAGEHAPDPDGLRRPDGTPAHVEDLLARPGVLLLVRTRDVAAVAGLRAVLGDLGTVLPVLEQADEAAGDHLVDPDGAVGRAYGLGDEGLALVRPDGYLGLVADIADPAVLRSYLADALHVVERAMV
jgi:hypothetical protein